FLDRMFVGGSAYMIGKMNGDHWYLYITGPNTQLTPPGTPDKEHSDTETKFINLPHRMSTSGMNGVTEEDQEDETLEVLMTDLEPENAKQFYLDQASAVAEGRHFQKAHDARKDAIKHLGTIHENPSSENGVGNGAAPSTNGRSNNPDAFDVFEQTSSDHSAYSSDDDDLTLPEELTTEGHALGKVVSDICGLSDVYPASKYPNARIDAYSFEPCGFSANGVVPAPDGSSDSKNSTHYFTVHVTPEPQCSYASFETNVPARQTGRETADIVAQVVSIFKPGRFSVTLFEAKPKEEEVGVVKSAKKSKGMENIEGYRRCDRIVHDLDGYDLVFRFYEREGFVGGGPRIGEVGF
ncbi:hypothetical protein LTS18_008725, partial [Coniosporium uncinatum]